MCLNELNKMIRTLFTSVACLEQCSQHPGKQEDIVSKGAFKIQYVVDSHFTILFVFPIAPVKGWGGVHGEAGVTVLRYVCLRDCGVAIV